MAIEWIKSTKRLFLCQIRPCSARIHHPSLFCVVVDWCLKASATIEAIRDWVRFKIFSSIRSFFHEFLFLSSYKVDFTVADNRQEIMRVQEVIIWICIYTWCSIAYFYLSRSKRCSCAKCGRDYCVFLFLYCNDNRLAFAFGTNAW